MKNILTMNRAFYYDEVYFYKPHHGLSEVINLHTLKTNLVKSQALNLLVVCDNWLEKGKCLTLNQLHEKVKESSHPETGKKYFDLLKLYQS